MHALDEVAGITKKYDQFDIILTGYTCNLGAENLNKDLSLQRVKIVAEYLAAKGVSSDRIITDDQGENNPIADNSTLEGKKQNRRVEFELKNK
ncbi:OmpA family protein [Fulvivirga maritima]|uniref:OmpA family protein n=1 Tax=Fulvivirga maritima TaxID=2904247 RepID=UPI00351E6FC0